MFVFGDCLYCELKCTPPLKIFSTNNIFWLRKRKPRKKGKLSNPGRYWSLFFISDIFVIAVQLFFLDPIICWQQVFQPTRLFGNWFLLVNMYFLSDKHFVLGQEFFSCQIWELELRVCNDLKFSIKCVPLTQNAHKAHRRQQNPLQYKFSLEDHFCPPGDRGVGKHHLPVFLLISH